MGERESGALVDLKGAEQCPRRPVLRRRLARALLPSTHALEDEAVSWQRATREPPAEAMLRVGRRHGSGVQWAGWSAGRLGRAKDVLEHTRATVILIMETSAVA